MNHCDLVEYLAAAVHRAYCVNFKKRNGADYWTLWNYNDLDEEGKEIDRVTVRAVLSALGNFGYKEDTNE